MASRGGGR
uniref:Uncharacterized protein n=1 Tax=Rhizophora mucronata TaxID=61149 RepID=A0A2P2MBD0_RHIMU